MKEIIPNLILQEKIIIAIRDRQIDYPQVLNPKDVRRLAEKAIKIICKENKNFALGGKDES